MGVGVKVRVWGNYALFSRPEMKVERCSYDVMTPSAARGILEAVYWHPVCGGSSIRSTWSIRFSSQVYVEMK